MKKLLVFLLLCLTSTWMYAQTDADLHWTPTNVGTGGMNMTMSAVLIIDGVEIGEEALNLEIGFFDSENVCRGAKLPKKKTTGGVTRYKYSPTLFGNDGDVLTCRIWDHVTDSELTDVVFVQNAENPIVFVTNGNLGTGSAPYELTFVTAGGITKEIDPYTDNSGWYLISSPVGTIDDLSTVTNLTTGEYDLYMFDQVGDADGKQWLNQEAGAFTSLEAGKGYLYANQDGNDITFPGTEYTGTGTFDLEYTPGYDFSGVNVMGNPFNSFATVDRPFYILDPTNNTYIENVAGSRVAAMTGIIVGAEGTGETVTFAPAGDKLCANATLSLTQNGNLVDRASMVFEGRNLPKMQFNPNHTKIYMPINGKDYAVAAVESFGEMPVNFKAENNGTFTLNFTCDEVSFEYLHLIDNMTGDNVDLLVNPSYTFNATTSDYASRFKLVFATGNSNSSEFAYVSNGNVIVNGEGMLQVIDMTGRVISTEQISGVSSIQLNAAAGVYVLQLNDKTQKIVVK